jgi:hypothetical protein
MKKALIAAAALVALTVSANAAATDRRPNRPERIHLRGSLPDDRWPTRSFPDKLRRRLHENGQQSNWTD